VRTAASLHQPARRLDLVGSVDRKIEAAELGKGRTSNPCSRVAGEVAT
jgi:hypothetical protein